MNIENLRRKAEQGDVNVQYWLGWMYHKGVNVEKDDAEAEKWWRLAAEQGDQWAQIRLNSLMLKKMPASRSKAVKQ